MHARYRSKLTYSHKPSTTPVQLPCLASRHLCSAARWRVGGRPPFGRHSTCITCRSFCLDRCPGHRFALFFFFLALRRPGEPLSRWLWFLAEERDTLRIGSGRRRREYAGRVPGASEFRRPFLKKAVDGEVRSMSIATRKRRAAGRRVRYRWSGGRSTAAVLRRSRKRSARQDRPAGTVEIREERLSDGSCVMGSVYTVLDDL